MHRLRDDENLRTINQSLVEVQIRIPKCGNPEFLEPQTLSALGLQWLTSQNLGRTVLFEGFGDYI